MRKFFTSLKKRLKAPAEPAKLECLGLCITLVRKNMKTMRLYVKPGGSVSLHAPYHVPEGELRDFVRSRYVWICRQQQRLTDISPACAAYEHDGFLNLWGKKYALRDGDPDKTSYIRLAHNIIWIYIRPGANGAAREKLIKNWLKQELITRAEPLLAFWAARMQVQPGGLRVRDMKTRWGSCNVRTRRICLNLRLSAYPERSLEYVIAHELAHLREKNHNKKFRDLMDAFVPDWAQRRRELNHIARHGSG